MNTRRKKTKSKQPSKKKPKKPRAKTTLRAKAKSSAAKKKSSTRKQRAPTRRAARATRAEKPLATLEAHSATHAAIAAAQPAALAAVKFEKLAGSPQLVRLEFKGADIIAAGQDKGSIPNVPVGSTIVVWVHVTGNPGAVAKISVIGALENPITVKVPLDSGQRSEPRNLLVTG